MSSRKNRNKKRGQAQELALLKSMVAAGNQSRALIPHPPPIPNVGVTHSCVMRYVTNAAVNGTITFASLLDTWLTALTSTTAVDLFDAVRVRRVEMWAISTGSGVPVTVTCNFVNTTLGAMGDWTQHSATSIGLEPAYLSAVPSKRAQCSNFQSSSVQRAFYLVAPTGTVIDVHLTYKLGLDNFPATAAANALVGAAAGVVYLRGLDGLPIASTPYIPQGTNDKL